MDSEETTGKTSSDILAELFSAFDAEPPVVADLEESSPIEHKSSKSKKAKKKHKKHKKKRRVSEIESDGKRSKRHKASHESEEIPIKNSATKDEAVENVTSTNSVEKIPDTKTIFAPPDLSNGKALKEDNQTVEEKKDIVENHEPKSEEGEVSDSSSNREESRRGKKAKKRRHSRSTDDSSSKRDDGHRSSRHEKSSRSSRGSRNYSHRHTEPENIRSRSVHDRLGSKRSDEKSSRSHRYSKNTERRRHSKEKEEDPDKIDKEKLLEIARRNAKKLISSGVVVSNKLVSITSGGKTVNELTEYCKKISKREALGDDYSDVETGSSDEDKMFHHPFQVKDRPNSIVMNIKNSVPLPVLKSHAERAIEQSKQLSLQFPVSSGSTHRQTENEWVPVQPEKEQPKPPKSGPLAIEAPPLKNFLPLEKAVVPMTYSLSAMPPPTRPVLPVIQPSVTDKTMANDGLDINDIVTKRLNALRKLAENPKDWQAKHQVSRTQTQVDRWMRDKMMQEKRPETGEFRGSTGVKILTQAELSSGYQAWAKRDQLISAQPVSSGMGMALLQKMGWQPGQGLGKNKEGTLEPLKLEVKTDKKGLVAIDESTKGSSVGLSLPTVKTLDGKHPVSLLNEYCTRRRWPQPLFEIAFECGPDHKKTFLFKVKVNGIEYQPTVASVNKKQAKAEAAAICLRALGLISGPTEGEIASGVAKV